MARRAVFLDRDGVINRTSVRDGKPYAPRVLADFRMLPGAAAAIARLRKAGFAVIVVTNQPDIGNGLVDPAVVEAMHERLRARAPVDDIRVCPHPREAGCDCRKPRPGMLLAAARDWDIDLGRSYMVGDRAGDVGAGRAAGCRAIFITRQYSEDKPKHPVVSVRSLAAAAAFILNDSEGL